MLIKFYKMMKLYLAVYIASLIIQLHSNQDLHIWQPLDICKDMLMQLCKSILCKYNSYSYTKMCMFPHLHNIICLKKKKMNI